MAEKFDISATLRLIDEASANATKIAASVGTARDQLLKLQQVEQVTPRLQQFQGAIGQLSNALGVFSPRLGFAAHGVTTFLGSLGKLHPVLLAVGAAAGAGGGLVALGTSAARAGDQLATLATRTGTSVEFLSSLQLAAKHGETTIEELAQGMKFLSRAMVEAQGGTGEYAQLFRELGIQIQDTRTRQIRPLEQVMLELSDAFARSADDAIKVDASMRLMQRSGEALIPFLNQGSAEIQRLMELARQMGITFTAETATSADRLGKKFDELRTSIKGVGTEIGSSLGPMLEFAVDQATRATNTIRGLVGSILRGAIDLSGIPRAIGALREIGVLGYPSEFGPEVGGAGGAGAARPPSLLRETAQQRQQRLEREAASARIATLRLPVPEQILAQAEIEARTLRELGQTEMAAIRMRDAQERARLARIDLGAARFPLAETEAGERAQEESSLRARGAMIEEILRLEKEAAEIAEFIAEEQADAYERRLQAAQQTADIEAAKAQILTQQAGLTQQQAAALSLQAIEAQRIAEITAARGDTERESLANLRAQVGAASILRREIERTDPLAGLRAGLRDVADEWESVGDVMRSGVRSMAQDMSRSMSDLFFNAITGQFRKLADIPKQLGASIARELSNIAASAVLQPLGAQIRGLFGAAPGLGAGGPLAALMGMGQAGAGGAPGSAVPGAPGVSPSQLGSLGQFFARPISAGGNVVQSGGQLIHSGSELASLGITAPGVAGASGATVGQALGGILGAAGLGLTLYGATQARRGLPNAIGSGISGAVSGAAIGTYFLPGIGTAIGAGVGALAGFFTGLFGGKGPNYAEERRKTYTGLLKEVSDAARKGGANKDRVTLVLSNGNTLGGMLMGMADVFLSGTQRHNLGEPVAGIGRLAALLASLGVQPETWRKVGTLDSFTEFVLASDRDEQSGRPNAELVLLDALAAFEGQSAQEARVTFGFETRGRVRGIGEVSRQVELPLSRLDEFPGLAVRDLAIARGTLAGLDDETARQFLERLIKVDRDHALNYFDANRIRYAGT